MTERKFTDEEVIKALECCGNQMYSCTDKQCKAKTLGDAFDLINRQKAEIERLEKGELSKDMTFNSETINRCVNEAIKEFAEEFQKRCLESGIYPVLIKNILKNLVKEKTEGKE